MGSPSPGQRIASLGAAIALNGAALAMLLLLRAEPSAPRANDRGGVLLVSIAPEPKSQQLSPLIKTPILQKIEAASQPFEQAAAPASTDIGTAAAADCPIVEDVAKGIIADRAAHDAIINAPPATRSIADAIVIWNAAWAPATLSTTAVPAAPLGPVRSNVQATLKAFPEKCLLPLVTGPRLIAIPNGDRSTILVFGSGEWSWATLLDPVAELPDQASVAQISLRVPDASRYR